MRKKRGVPIPKSFQMEVGKKKAPPNQLAKGWFQKRGQVEAAPLDYAD